MRRTFVLVVLMLASCGDDVGSDGADGVAPDAPASEVCETALQRLASNGCSVDEVTGEDAATVQMKCERAMLDCDSGIRENLECWDSEVSSSACNACLEDWQALQMCLGT